MKRISRQIGSITVTVAILFNLIGCATQNKVIEGTKAKELFDEYPTTGEYNKKVVGDWVFSDLDVEYKFKDDGTGYRLFLSNDKNKNNIGCNEFEYRVSPTHILIMWKRGGSNNWYVGNPLGYSYFFKDNKLFFRGYYCYKGEPRLILAWEAYRRGYQQENKENLELAIAEYTKALEYLSNYKSAQDAIERISYEISLATAKNDPVASVSTYLQKLMANPSDKDSLKMLSDLYKSNNSLFKPEDFDKLIPVARKAYFQYPYGNIEENLVNLYRLQGQMYFTRKEYDKSFASYKALYALGNFNTPFYSDPLALDELATAFSRDNKYSTVLEVYRIRYPDLKEKSNVNQYYSLFRSCINKSDIETAQAIIDLFKKENVQGLSINVMENDIVKVVKNNEDRQSAIKSYELANSYRDKKDYVNALKSYRAAMRLYPGYEDARKNFEEVKAKYLADNPKLFPAPFEGKWQYISPQSYKTEKYSELETEFVPDSYSPQGGSYVNKWVTKERTITIPSVTYTIQFSGRNVTISIDGKPVTNSGTFFYYGDTIELGEVCLTFDSSKNIIYHLDSNFAIFPIGVYFTRIK